MADEFKWDIFISHATEDKETVAILRWKGFLELKTGQFKVY
jgi:hypothetical protein